MAVTASSRTTNTDALIPDGAVESTVSAVAWGPVIAGAFTAAALSLVLIALGSGLGLASISPWPNDGASGKAFTVMMGVWMIVVHWLPGAFGGYLTGRLRTKWATQHTDEVFFRDTAHGLLAWAVGAVVGAMLITSAAGNLIGGTARTAATAVSGITESAAQAAGEAVADSGVNPLDAANYYIDRMLRSDQMGSGTDTREVRAEIARIFTNGIKDGELSGSDRAYLAQIISTRTGLSTVDVEQRIDEALAQAKEAEKKAREAADDARKAAATISLFTALAMLIGAFISSAAAALGGRHRDDLHGLVRTKSS